MPLYVADYLADTGHLSAAEHGAYLLLIMHYWTNGELPRDPRQLARIVRMNPRQWDAIAGTVLSFFDETLRHKRIDMELALARQAYERRAAAGRRGGRGKKQCFSNEKALRNHIQTQTQEAYASSPSQEKGCEGEGIGLPGEVVAFDPAAPFGPRRAAR